MQPLHFVSIEQFISHWWAAGCLHLVLKLKSRDKKVTLNNSYNLQVRCDCESRCIAEALSSCRVLSPSRKVRQSVVTPGQSPILPSPHSPTCYTNSYIFLYLLLYETRQLNLWR
jgi:hypothetical protein